MSVTNDFKPVCVGDLIKEIDKYSFTIPSFQRGYRWDDTQVTDLLEDLNQFVNGSGGNCYYLQPLIVCKKDDAANAWNVLDGQQRLTTILLIIKNLKCYTNHMDSEKIDKGLYSIEFESRAVVNFDCPDKDLDINNYYVYMANETIKAWISKYQTKPNANTYLSAIIQALLMETPAEDQNELPSAKYVKFIWFDISDGKTIDSDLAIEIYNRFNSNHIKLTPSELIKALYVLDKKNHDPDGLPNFLNDWNGMERQFLRDDFWKMFSLSERQTRIDFLFDFIEDNLSSDDALKDKAYRNYQKLYDEKRPLNDKWETVKDNFNDFVKCFESIEFYNYFGYLVYIGISIKKIMSITNDVSIDYKEKLKQLQGLIRAYFKKKKIISFDDIKSLNYNDDYYEVKSILLLYNIETCNHQHIKFNFNEFYKDKWEIEHVDSQNKTFTSNSSKIEWIDCVADALRLFVNDSLNQSLLDRGKDIKYKIESNTIINKDFDDYKIDIDDYFAEKDKSGKPIRLGEDEKQCIWNLALLDKPTNIGFSNSPFPAKRQYLIQKRVEEGKFVPICTERLFLKYFVFTDVTTKPINLDLLHWTRDDRECYINDLKKKLVTFKEV